MTRCPTLVAFVRGGVGKVTVGRAWPVDDAKHEIAMELDGDEQLLWSGSPRRGVVFRQSDVFLIPFSLLWGGFALFWETIALMMMVGAGGHPVAFIFPLFGLPFVIIGLYLMFGRFWVDARIRARTFYGVTTKRIIIISGLFSRKIKSLDLRTLTDISFTERTDRTGIITFGPSHPFAWMYGGMQWPGMGHQLQPSFEMIEDVRRVYNTIRAAKEST